MDILFSALHDSFPWHALVLSAGIGMATAVAAVSTYAVTYVIMRIWPSQNKAYLGVGYVSPCIHGISIIVSCIIVYILAGYLRVPTISVLLGFAGAIVGTYASMAVTAVSYVYGTTYNDIDSTSSTSLSRSGNARQGFAHGVTSIACGILFLLM